MHGRLIFPITLDTCRSVVGPSRCRLSPEFLPADLMVLTQLRTLLWYLDGLAGSVFLFAAVDCAARTIFFGSQAMSCLSTGDAGGLSLPLWF